MVKSKDADSVEPLSIELPGMFVNNRKEKCPITSYKISCEAEEKEEDSKLAAHFSIEKESVLEVKPPTEKGKFEFCVEALTAQGAGAKRRFNF